MQRLLIVQKVNNVFSHKKIFSLLVPQVPTIWTVKCLASPVLKARFVQSARVYGLLAGIRCKMASSLLLEPMRLCKFQQVGTLIVPIVT